MAGFEFDVIFCAGAACGVVLGLVARAEMERARRRRQAPRAEIIDLAAYRGERFGDAG